MIYIKRFNESFSYNSKIDSDLVKVGDKVSYEKDSGGHDIKMGHKITRKSHNTGEVIEKMPVRNRISPKFKIRNSDGQIDVVSCSSVIDIIK
jgi:hypothetical protein